MNGSSAPVPAPPRDAWAHLLPPDVGGGDPPPPAAVGVVEAVHAARAVWAGVVWSRLARGDLAWAWWDRVAVPALQPWVAAERGRVLRELGLHAEAERLEQTALDVAVDPVDHAMLLVSLTADAVGRGDVAEAVRRFGRAEAAVGRLPDGPRAARQRLRLSWVRVEVAWARGDDPTDDGLPRWPDGRHEPELPADLVHGTSFHRSKALLFGGLVAASVPLLDLALVSAPPVLAWAIHLARADLGAPDGATRAAAAWQAVVPPEAHSAAVRATPTARRLQGA